MNSPINLITFCKAGDYVNLTDQINAIVNASNVSPTTTTTATDETATQASTLIDETTGEVVSTVAADVSTQQLVELFEENRRIAFLGGVASALAIVAVGRIILR